MGYTAEQINNALLGNSLGISIQTFIGVSNRLQVPNQLKIDTNPSVNLNRADLATVIAVRDNIAKPQDESNGEQWLQYGNQLYRIDKYSDAVLAFDQAINKGQQYKLAGNYGKASALFSTKDYYQALAAISRAISFIGVSERKGYYYLWKYQSIVFRELGKYDSAMQSINVAIRLEPSDLRLLNEKAVLFGMRKQYLEAIAIYDLLSSKQPEAYVYYGRGHFKYLLGQRETAIADFDRAISLNPSYAEAYSHRGVSKSDLEKYKEAIADYDRAISINPNYAEPYLNRGNVKVALGQIKEAVADYDLAVSLNPNFTYAYYNRAFLKYRLNQNKEAIADYDRAISLISNTINPNTINPNLASAYNNRAAPKSALGQKKEAITDYSKAISINPKLVTAYIGRSINKFELGNNSGALIDIEQSIIIRPNNATAFNNRGFYKIIMGKEREALPDLERSIALDASQSESYACRGFIKEIFGDKQGAMVDYKQALKINPKLIEDWKKQASFLKRYNQASYQKYQQLIEKLEAATKPIS